MPTTGNSYVATLKNTHFRWGLLRYTSSRPKITNEGFIPIPIKYAKLFNITNKNGLRLGQSNIYKFSTTDGFLKDMELKASGSSKRGDMYAKNLHGNGNLKLLGTWFVHIKAQVGMQINVEFISPTEILLTKL